MRVLHLIPSFGSGGAERQLALLAPALAGGGVETHVAHLHGGPNGERLRNTAVQLHALPARGHHDPRLLSDVRQLIRRIQPDILQTWLLQMDVVGGLASVRTPVPWLLCERSAAAAYPAGWKTRLRVSLARRRAWIAANSQGGLAYWRAQIHEPGRLHHVPNCITPEDSSVQPDLPQAPYVLYAGRFSEEKNVGVLIQALLATLKARQGLRAELFGEGPLKGQVTQAVQAAGLEGRVGVHGYTPHLAAWMRGARICVSLSHFEGHPNVVLEAAALGCPLVLSDIAAHREFLDDRAAWFTGTGDASQAQAVITQVLDQPQLAATRAARAQSAVAHLSLSAACGAYMQIYQSMRRARPQAASPTVSSPHRTP